MCNNFAYSQTENCNFFSEFKKFYSDNNIKIEYIIPSSPVISTSRNSFISVGVIKFKDNRNSKTKNMGTFWSFNNLIDFSEVFLFYYEFDKEGKIVGISQFFIPSKNNTTSISVEGITKYNDKIIVSYCENSSVCKILVDEEYNILENVIVKCDSLSIDNGFAFLQ